MKIQLNQDEIEVAVRNYVSEMGINIVGKAVEVNFTSGRGERGLTADLDIVELPAATVGVPFVKATAGETTGKAATNVVALTGKGETKAVVAAETVNPFVAEAAVATVAEEQPHVAEEAPVLEDPKEPDEPVVEEGAEPADTVNLFA